MTHAIKAPRTKAMQDNCIVSIKSSALNALSRDGEQPLPEHIQRQRDAIVDNDMDLQLKGVRGPYEIRLEEHDDVVEVIIASVNSKGKSVHFTLNSEFYELLKTYHSNAQQCLALGKEYKDDLEDAVGEDGEALKGYKTSDVVQTATGALAHASDVLNATCLEHGVLLRQTGPDGSVKTGARTLVKFMADLFLTPREEKSVIYRDVSAVTSPIMDTERLRYQIDDYYEKLLRDSQVEIPRFPGPYNIEIDFDYQTYNPVLRFRRAANPKGAVFEIILDKLPKLKSADGVITDPAQSWLNRLTDRQQLINVDKQSATAATSEVRREHHNESADYLRELLRKHGVIAPKRGIDEDFCRNLVGVTTQVLEKQLREEIDLRKQNGSWQETITPGAPHQMSRY